MSEAPARADRFASVSGALLLGGASSRMGRDKAGIEIAGEAAGGRLAELLDSLCGEVLLVGGEPAASWPGRTVRDPEGPRCALRGLVATLRAAEGDKVLVVATDYYGLTLDLLLALLAHPESPVVVPRDDHLHPLCALYERAAVLPMAETALDSGELALRPVLEKAGACFLEGEALAPFASGGAALANVNTPEELERFRVEAQ